MSRSYEESHCVFFIKNLRLNYLTMKLQGEKVSWIGGNISIINRIHESCACQDYK